MTIPHLPFRYLLCLYNKGVGPSSHLTATSLKSFPFEAIGSQPWLHVRITHTDLL